MNRFAPPTNTPAENEILGRWKTSEAPAVSICCATYNHAQTIEDALNGFLNQKTDFPFEIIIRDDASSDGTAEILRSFAEKYPRLIRLVLNAENQYSKGVRPGQVWPDVARGEFLAICEGDDYWIEPKKLQHQFELMRTNPEAVFCVAMTAVCNGAGAEFELENYVGFAPRETLGFDQAINCYFHTSTHFIRKSVMRDIVSRYLSQNALLGDSAIQFLLATYGPVVYLPELVSVYRKTGDGIWTELGRQKQLEWELAVATNLSRVLGGDPAEIQRAKARMFSFKLFTHNFGEKRIVESIRYVPAAGVHVLLKSVAGVRNLFKN